MLSRGHAFQYEGNGIEGKAYESFHLSYFTICSSLSIHMKYTTAYRLLYDKKNNKYVLTWDATCIPFPIYWKVNILVPPKEWHFGCKMFFLDSSKHLQEIFVVTLVEL